MWNHRRLDLHHHSLLYILGVELTVARIDLTLAEARALVTLSERCMEEARRIGDMDAYEMAYKLRAKMRQAVGTIDSGELP